MLPLDPPIGAELAIRGKVGEWMKGKGKALPEWAFYNTITPGKGKDARLLASTVIGETGKVRSSEKEL